METKNYIILNLIVPTILTFSMAQDNLVIHPGLIRSQLTISPSYMISDQRSYFYLHGNLEGFLEKNISISGEGYLSLGSISSEKSKFDYNHSLFFGANRHFTHNNNDFYIGVQPGISFTKLSASENNLTTASGGINPLFSTVIGYNFYLNRIFHFFLQSRVVIGQHGFDISKNISEIRFSAGLGFNINSKK